MYSLEEECDVITNPLEYGKTWVAERKFALRERILMWTLWLSLARQCLDMKWEHTIHYYILMLTVDFSFLTFQNQITVSCGYFKNLKELLGSMKGPAIFSVIFYFILFLHGNEPKEPPYLQRGSEVVSNTHSTPCRYWRLLPCLLNFIYVQYVHWSIVQVGDRYYY
jgi:hypothetical protein